MFKDDAIREILEEVICEVGDENSRIYEGYSGRGMYGGKCFGVVVPSSQYIQAVEAAASLGLYGAKVDQMGRDMIVYWPSPRISAWETNS